MTGLVLGVAEGKVALGEDVGDVLGFVLGTFEGDEKEGETVGAAADGDTLGEEKLGLSVGSSADGLALGVCEGMVLVGPDDGGSVGVIVG